MTFPSHQQAAYAAMAPAAPHKQGFFWRESAWFGGLL